MAERSKALRSRVSLFLGNRTCSIERFRGSNPRLVNQQIEYLFGPVAHWSSAAGLPICNNAKGAGLTPARATDHTLLKTSNIINIILILYTEASTPMCSIKPFIKPEEWRRGYLPPDHRWAAAGLETWAPFDRRWSASHSYRPRPRQRGLAV